MSIFNIMMFVVVGFIGVYLLIDRICRCVEQKNISKAFGKAIEEGKISVADDDYINKNIL